ncbi:medium-wave-sensitive opsin 1-like [Orbicella faveolata]|uniref:medium-wave-sensitive opsin 1-like n=1 Tax=Orbicella faveolata TaxID=48498 RepID=UPI0009E55ED3|nr:medium-wave-sensitive opsin 1-like [Orbicella faveolata]
MAILQNAELQKGLNLLIVSLTAADLTNCLIAQPMYVYYLGNEVGGTYLVAFETIAFIGLHAVFTNLTAITYHRMKALSRPFHHLLVSRKDLVVVIMLTWVVSIVIGVVFATEPGKRVGVYFHGVMILSLVLTYIKILWVSWRRRRRKIAERPGTANFHQQAATMEQENAAAITSAILVGSTLLCFLPDVVLDLMGKAEINRLMGIYTLLFASSALNPCVVIWRNQQFRRTLLQMLRLAN